MAIPSPRAAPRDRISSRQGDAHLRAASDDTLLTLVRQQHPRAFGELYRRHRPRAYRYARMLTYRYFHRDAADDLVAEAIRKILTALVNGRGPRHGFQAYLITTIRSVAFRESTRARDDAPVDGDDLFEAAADDDLDSYVVVDALASLPERAQRVLWLAEALRLPPAEVAERLGTTPGSVPMLALRAREALRIAYLRQHLPSATDPRCGRAIDLLARRPVTTLSPRQLELLDHHLGRCDTCAAAAAQVDEEIASWSQSGRAAARFGRHLDDRAVAVDHGA